LNNPSAAEKAKVDAVLKLVSKFNTATAGHRDRAIAEGRRLGPLDVATWRSEEARYEHDLLQALFALADLWDQEGGTTITDLPGKSVRHLHKLVARLQDRTATLKWLEDIATLSAARIATYRVSPELAHLETEEDALISEKRESNMVSGPFTQWARALHSWNEERSYALTLQALRTAVESSPTSHMTESELTNPDGSITRAMDIVFEPLPAKPRWWRRRKA
jgi:hypothetical protein